jgi:hypothetical protein
MAPSSSLGGGAAPRGPVHPMPLPTMVERATFPEAARRGAVV